MDWYTIFMITVFAISIVKAVEHIKSNIKENKIIDDYLAYKASETVNNVIAPNGTKPIEICHDAIGRIQIALTPRIFSEVNEFEKSFTLRAIHQELNYCLILTIFNKAVQIPVIDDDSFIAATVVHLRSAGNQSDHLLRFLIRLWNIERTGKPRMKPEVFCYSTNLGLNDLSLEKPIRFTCNFGVQYKGQVDPSLTFEIDWNGGIAKIQEDDIIFRELIINRLMN